MFSFLSRDIGLEMQTDKTLPTEFENRQDIQKWDKFQAQHFGTVITFQNIVLKLTAISFLCYAQHTRSRLFLLHLRNQNMKNLESYITYLPGLHLLPLLTLQEKLP